MNPIAVFASQLGAKITLNSDFIMEKNQRYYLFNNDLKKLAKSDYYYAGLYLGKVKNSVFFPSFNLLNILENVAVNKIVLGRKAAWLFICGRDVFRTGILKVYGSKQKGSSSLVLNEFGECLGFGKILFNLDKSGREVVLRNILDVGDFLRREK